MIEKFRSEKTISLFDFPTRIVFGPGAIGELGHELKRLGMGRPLLVTDSGLVQCGIAQQVMEIAARSGFASVLYDGVSPNPTEENVAAGLERYGSGNCDGIVAVGGGSPLDAAKAIRLRVTHTLPLDQYDDLLNGGEKIAPNLPPLIAIPTTAGTGSEVSRSTVITLKATDRKTVIFSPHLIPPTAIADPQLTLDMPPKLTAGTGLDALTHNVEAYLSKGYHPLCDAIALQGTRLVVRHLATAVHNGKDLAARTHMMMAAMMGAVAFQKGLGATHSLAHPLSSIGGLHHGTANAVLLPHVLEFNREVSEERLRDLAVAMELEITGFSASQAASALIERVRSLLRELDIPGRLSAYGITRAMIPPLAEKAMQDGCRLGNPRACSQFDMVSLYNQAL